ncbi:MAG: DUF4918 family protein [Cyclobacteriaceae bacterium]
MHISDLILNFYKQLRPPERLPQEVNVLNPYADPQTWALIKTFYHKYYNNDENRVIVFGINPGRFGGGITGIPFTDPIKLEEACDIPNAFDKRAELSSRFIYDMIEAFGGPTVFYSTFYISAVSPLGYMMNGKNLNYYDIPDWKNLFTDYAVRMIRDQSAFIRNDLAICIGQGQNLKFLEEINREHQFFERIITVPHPRWIMQYRLKKKDQFIQEYLNKLNI